MKRSVYAEPEPEKPKQESLDDRDRRMESAYHYDRQGERSTLSYVCRFRDELVEEFFSWRRQMTAEGTWSGETIFDALRRWERTRFGADLYVSAHAVLSFCVRLMLASEDGGIVLPAVYTKVREETLRQRNPVLPSHNLDVIAAKAAREHEMPRTHLSRKERDEQLSKAYRQADEIRAEAEKENP